MTPVLLSQLELAADPVRWYPAGQSHNSSTGLRYDRILGYGSFGQGLSDEIFNALRIALRRSAAEYGTAIAPLIKQLTATDLLSAHQLAAGALSGCAAPLLPDALAWASQQRVRGLGQGPTSGWSWGEVLAHLAGESAADRDSVINLVMAPYHSIDFEALAAGIAQPHSLTEEERKRTHEAKTLAVEQIVALSLIARRLNTDTPDIARARLVQLEQILGPAPATPNPPMPIYARALPSPIEDSKTHIFGDTDWTTAILTYTNAPPPRGPGTRAEGGVYEVATQLQAAAKAEPARFARLIVGIGSKAHAAYIHAVIQAATSAAQDIAEQDLTTLFQLIRAVSSWSQPEFNQPLCGLIGALASHELPEDIINLVANIATTAVDPLTNRAARDDTDLIAAGWNSDRGQAVRIMTYLLAPPETREHRAQLLLPALHSVVHDPAEQVRAMLPPVITRAHPYSPDDASRLTRQWLAQASEHSLRAPELDTLAWQLLLRRESIGIDLARRMIDSAIPEARTRGGALAALAALYQVQLPEQSGRTSSDALLGEALNDSAARNGVAILTAQLADELPEPPSYDAEHIDPHRVDRGLLILLLNDDDDDVRTSALGFALNITTSLKTSGKLLSATASSRAFAENASTVLYALREATEALPIHATLDICEHWISIHAKDAGDISTVAAADAYNLVDLVLAAHAHTTTGSSERGRCLTLLDHLIEADALEASAKVDLAEL